MPSDALRFLLQDSRDLVLFEEASPTAFTPFLFFEDFPLEALGGAVEQVATATALSFLLTPRGRERSAV
jgi:hypothetical protein